MNQLICIDCKEKHKARSDKFLVVRVDDNDKEKILGYICKKCANKKTRQQLVKNFKIKQSKEGKTFNQQISEHLINYKENK